MAKLILSMFMSLDGYTEGPDGFVPPAWSGDMERHWSGENLTGVARLLYGRNNFVFNRDFWSDPNGPAAGSDQAALMNGLKKTVVSTTLTGDPGWNGEVAADIASVARLKQETDGEIQSFGGAGLADSLIRADLIDVYRLLVIPALYGGGKRLFTDGRPGASLALVSARTLDTGAVLLTYAKA